MQSHKSLNVLLILRAPGDESINDEILRSWKAHVDSMQRHDFGGTDGIEFKWKPGNAQVDVCSSGKMS